MYEDYNDERKNNEENIIDVTEKSEAADGSNARYTSYTSYSSTTGTQNTDRAEEGARYKSYTSSAYTGNSYTNAGSTGNNNANGYTQYQFSGAPRQPKPERPEKKSGAFWKKAVTAVALGLIFGGCAGVGLFAVNAITGANAPKTQSRIEAPASTAPTTSSISTAEESGKVVTTAKASTAISTTDSGDVAQVAENSMPAVVAITNNYTYYTQDWFGQQYKGESEASGSGIIVGKSDTDLFIATNQHVVSSADSLTVQFIDETTADATLKSQDTSADIAIVTVPISSLSAETLNKIKVITLGNPDSLKVGQQVVAIGNALGYGQSVTTGIISAIDREVDLSNGKRNLIQTDAAINPGNSGGALLDMDGNLIGINEAKLSGGGIEGMGYAIPISVAQPIMDKLMTKDVQENHGYLGISGANVTEEVAKTYEMPQGVYISKAEPGLAAANAGLKKGDIITAFDGQEVKSMSQLQELIQYYSVGEEIEVTYCTQGSNGYEEKTTKVTLTDYPDAKKKSGDKDADKKSSEDDEEDDDDERDSSEEQEEGDMDIRQFNNLEDFFRMFGNY